MESDALAPACEKCGSAVVLECQPVSPLSRGELDRLPSGVWRYRAFLPRVDYEGLVTLGEGGTPLLHAERLGTELGLRTLLIKDETRNPTGSFLDRGSTVLLTLARQRGVKECSCVTTGNLGASLSAYCAKAGLGAQIRIHPNTDQGKLYQMLAFGAEIEADRSEPRSRGTRSLAVTAANPYLLEGEKTTGMELVHDLEWRAPDVIVIPVGTGGHLSMTWRAITQLRDAGLVDNSECRLIGVKIEDHLPSLRPPGGEVELPASASHLAELEESEPYFRTAAAAAMSESGGLALTVAPSETIRATTLLARTEGIFAEPASSSVVAALADAVGRGEVARGDTVVCVVTGAGLKDTRAISRLARETRRVGPTEVYPLPSSRIGSTKLAMLRLLSMRPRYGYELWLRLGTERKISTASIYQHLAELDSYGMVRRSGTVTAKGRERVQYDITRKGADFLRVAQRLGQANFE